MGEHLTENIPSAPQATELDPQHPEGHGQEALQTPPQNSPAPSYPGQTQAYVQPGVYPPQGQWAAVPAKPASSGYRVASGIIGIVLGAWLFLPALVGMEFFVLIAALGNITAGIVLLANQRSRQKGSPVTALIFAGLVLLLGLLDVVLPFMGMLLPLAAVFLALPLIIVMSIGLAKEKRSA
jgi:hypothetical protein